MSPVTFGKILCVAAVGLLTLTQGSAIAASCKSDADCKTSSMGKFCVAGPPWDHPVLACAKAKNNDAADQVNKPKPH